MNNEFLSTFNQVKFQYQDISYECLESAIIAQMLPIEFRSELSEISGQLALRLFSKLVKDKTFETNKVYNNSLTEFNNNKEKIVEEVLYEYFKSDEDLKFKLISTGYSKFSTESNSIIKDIYDKCLFNVRNKIREFPKLNIISWNVNGIRSCYDKNLIEFIDSEQPDILCIQEVKCLLGDLPYYILNDLEERGYRIYINSAEKAGYAGTAVITRCIPNSVAFGFITKNDNGVIIEKEDEGRIITCVFDNFYLVTAYVPNSKIDHERLDYRMEWEDKMRDHLGILKADKEVIYCGDLNCANQPIDCYKEDDWETPGTTYQERQKFCDLLNTGFYDLWRLLNKGVKKYSWWSYMRKAREKNHGMRLDYFLLTNKVAQNCTDVDILNDVQGSDHCPVKVVIRNYRY